MILTSFSIRLVKGDLHLCTLHTLHRYFSHSQKAFSSLVHKVGKVVDTHITEPSKSGEAILTS